jgi:hypothetical protein
MLSLNTGCSGSLSVALNSSRKRALGHDVAVNSTACDRQQWMCANVSVSEYSEAVELVRARTNAS